MNKPRTNVISNDNYKYRVFIATKTRYNEKTNKISKVREVVVVEHEREWDAPEVIVECVGDSEGRVYATGGTICEIFPTTGRVRYTLKEVTEQVQDYVNRTGRY